MNYERKGTNKEGEKSSTKKEFAPAGNGRIDVGDILNRAISEDEASVKKLFSGFIDENEEIKGCGYLGSLGFILAEHSFWCVTDRRACSLRIKHGGELVFSSGYLEFINSEVFYQPSLVFLWVMIVILVIASFGIGILFIPALVRSFYQVKKSGLVFWVREGIPIYVFADRVNLKKAQRVLLLIGNSRIQAKRNSN